MSNNEFKNKERTIKLVQSDDKSKRILQYLYDSENGEANYTEIRTEARINNRTTMNNKIKKLEEELGLIENIGYDDQAATGARNPPRLFKLTDKAINLIKSGDILADEVLDQGEKEEITLSKNEYEDLVEQVDSLENNLKLMRATGQTQNQETEEIVEKVKQELDDEYAGKQAIQKYLQAISLALEQQTGNNLQHYVEQVE